MIKFYSKVARIEHKSKVMRSWMEGETFCTEEQDRGWFMLLDGSWESLYVGETAPEGFKVGDEVEVIIQRKS
jgi:hypothetical protein